LYARVTSGQETNDFESHHAENTDAADLKLQF
jgi:hypothetical protein